MARAKAATGTVKFQSEKLGLFFLTAIPALFLFGGVVLLIVWVEEREILPDSTLFVVGTGLTLISALGVWWFGRGIFQEEDWVVLDPDGFTEKRGDRQFRHRWSDCINVRLVNYSIPHVEVILQEPTPDVPSGIYQFPGYCSPASVLKDLVLTYKAKVPKTSSVIHL